MPLLCAHRCPGSRVKPIQEGGDAENGSAPEPQGEDLTLYLHLYADFLPKTDVDYDARPWNDCDPFVVVKAHNVKGQKNLWTTNVQRNRQREVEWECLSIQVCRESRRQRVVFEVFDSDTPFVFGSGILKQQIGMASLNRIALNRPTWLHMFGGAPDGSREDYNSMMIKGALDPPSTYHGSLCVLADTKRTRRRDWPPFPERCGVAVHIQIAIGRALYLPDSYREREVNLLIQVPGCLLELPGRQTVARRSIFTRGWRPKPPTLTSRLSGVRRCREMSEIPSANADILEFPGYVDSKGVLRVYNWSGPRSEMQHDAASEFRKAAGRNERVHDHEHSMHSDILKLPPSLLNAWVLRESERVFLLPQVQWAYIYVVPVGEEDCPPKIFGRVPLKLSKGTKDAFDKQGVRAETNEWPPPEACDFEHSDHEMKLDLVVKAKEEAEAKVPPHPAIRNNPEKSLEGDAMQSGNLREPDDTTDIEPLKWIQLHWDQSVTPLPECRFPSTFAACLLVSARAILGHPISFTDRDSAFVYGSEGGMGDYGHEREPDTSDRDKETDISSAKALAVPNEVPRPEISMVLCGLDTRQQRCGHSGKMVLSESLFSVSPPGWHHQQPVNSAERGEGALQSAPSIAPSPFYKKVYFHGDVLQARSLPAMDNDALVNPFWIIEVENEVIKMVDESLIDREMSCLKSSLNPAFLNRTVAPVYLYLSPGKNARHLSGGGEIPPFEHLFLPIPPVLVRLFDVDIGKKGEVIKEMMAVVVDWDPANLDSRFKAYGSELAAIEKEHVSAGAVRSEGGKAETGAQTSDSPTDVNYAHEAVWYSLVNNEQIRYSTAERSVARSLDWDTKPRLLGAFGFSVSGLNEGMKKHLEDAHAAASPDGATRPHRTFNGMATPTIQWPVVALDSLAAASTTRCKLLRYHFDVDILGVRFLSTDELEDTSELLLQLSAFWQGRTTDLQLVLSPADSSGPNVVALLSETEPVLCLSARAVWPIFMSFADCSTGPGHWVGARVSTCSFVTPYLPYIQSLPSMERRQKTEEGHERADDGSVPIPPASSATTAQGEVVESSPGYIVGETSSEQSDSETASTSSVGSGIMQRVGLKAVLPDICCRLVNREGSEIATLSLALNSFVKVPQGERCLKLQLDSPLLASLPPPMMDMAMMEQRTMPTLPFLNTVELDVFIECFSEHTGDLIYDSDCRAGRVLTDHDMFFVRDYNGEVHTHIVNADDHFVGYEDKVNVPFVEPILWADLNDPGPSTAEYKNFYQLTRRTRVRPGAPRAGTSRIGLYVSKTFRTEKNEESTKKKEFGYGEEARVQYATRTWVRKRGHEASLEDESTCLLARLMIMRSEYHGEEDFEGATLVTEQWRRRRLLPTFNMINIFTKKDEQRLQRLKLQVKQTDQQQVEVEILELESELSKLEATGWVRVTDVTMMGHHLWNTPRSIHDASDERPEDHRPRGASCLEVERFRQPQQLSESALSSRPTSPSVNTSIGASGYPPPAVLIAPPMHHWLVEVVVVHVYVLTARNLQNVDTLSLSDPYLKVQLGQQQYPDTHSPTGVATICRCVVVHQAFEKLVEGHIKLGVAAERPGCQKGRVKHGLRQLASAMTSDLAVALVSLSSWCLLYETFSFVGRGWLCCRWLTLRSSRISDYQKDWRVSQRGSLFPEAKMRRLFETCLSCETPPSGACSWTTPADVCVLVFQHGDSDPYEELPISTLGTQTEFELRLIIWRVDNITVFKGSSGERNDLKVHVEIYLTDFDLADTRESFDTDVHFFSRKKATFNWRITKRVKLPLASISVKLTLVDINAPPDDNALYSSELLSLDAFALTAMSKYRQDQSVIAPIDYAVEFDDPLGAGMVEHWCQAFWCAPYEAMGCPTSVTGCCNRREVAGNFLEDRDDSVAMCCCLGYCCCGRGGKRRRMGVRAYSPAILHCTVSLVPKSEAEAHPVGAGRAAPDPLSEPTDRPSPNMMLTDPVGYLTVVFGDQTCALMQCVALVATPRLSTQTQMLYADSALEGNLNGMLCSDDPPDDR
ncbi:hypothetical protein ACSSS7_004981 [Eimeria intestinalis]